MEAQLWLFSQSGQLAPLSLGMALNNFQQQSAYFPFTAPSREVFHRQCFSLYDLDAPIFTSAQEKFYGVISGDWG